MTRRALALPLLLSTLACGPVRGDATTTSSGATTTTAASSATDGSSTADASGSGSSTGDTSPVACEFGGCPLSQQACAPACGTPPSPFDADGCLRRPCTADGECAADERCFRGQDFGLCESSGRSCSEDPDGTCLCTADDDCGGGHCIPAAELPRVEAPPVEDVADLFVGCTGSRVRLFAPDVEDPCNAATELARAQISFRSTELGAVLDPEATDDFWREGDITHPLVAAGGSFDGLELTHYWVIYADDDGLVWVEGDVSTLVCGMSTVPCG